MLHQNLSVREGNKILAQFMGVVVSTPYPDNKEEIYYHYDFGTCTHKSDYKSPDNRRHHTEHTIKYFSSWDWIMPVVDKVTEICEESHKNNAIQYNDVSINDCSFEINYLINCISYDKEKEETKLQMVWRGLVNFINNYNNKEYEL